MNPSRLEVLFSPAEFGALKERDLSQTTCVVFDVLRATTSIVTALDCGAIAVVPVESIEEAVDYKKRIPEVLLAGERHGLRISAEISGGVEFDFGNSPREFTENKVAGRVLVMTTTNGTRGLKSCAGAAEVLAAGFVNLSATRRRLEARDRVLIICSGTYEEASYEDTLAAGALADVIWSHFPADEIADSAQIARNIFLAAKADLVGAMQYARNGRRLFAMRDLSADVAFCLERDSTKLVAGMVDGRVIKVA